MKHQLRQHDDDTTAATSILLFHGHDVFSSSSVADQPREHILHDDDLAEMLFDLWLLRQPEHPHHQGNNASGHEK
jgi:hypothetical protein